MAGNSGPAAPRPPFLEGGGALGDLIAGFDWAATSLGPISTWPAALKATVGLILRSPVPLVTLWGEDGVMIYNDAYSHFAAGRHPQLLGSKVREGWPEVADFNDNVMKVGLAGGTLSYRDQELVLNRSGSAERVWLNLDYSPVLDDDGRPAGVIAIVVETSSERLAIDALLEREAQLSAFIDQAVAGFSQVDLSGLFTLVNDRFCEISGRSREELLTLRMQDITHPDDLPANLGKFDRAVAQGEPYIHEKRYVRPDGSIVWVHNSVSVIRAADGEPEGVLAITLDVTERRVAEAAIRENELRLRALTDNLPGGMVYQLATGADGADRRFLFVSQSHEKLTGIPAEAVLADPTIPYGTVLPEDRETLAAAEAAALAARSVFDVAVRIRRADGEVRWCRIISAPRDQPDGSLVWDGIQIDITDQKRAEAALRASEEHLGTALAIARLGTFEWDFATQEISLDLRARALFGFGPDEPIGGADLFSRVPDADEVERIRTAVLGAGETGGRLDIEHAIVLPDGTRRMIASLADVVRGLDGEQGRMVGVFADITERKRLEQDLHRLNETLEERVRERTDELERVHEQLRQSQKLEAMGQLTGGVAHDFNNLLTPIIGSLDLLQRRQIGDEREQRMIVGALESAERAKTLVQRLLAFARRQPLQPGPVRLDAVVNGMAELVASTSGPKVRLNVDVSSDLPAARADQNQLEMAILNLCVNARDAMPDGGTLSISAGVEQVESGHRTLLAPGAYLRLSVADTGAGMDEDTLAKAIEPFFSTKGIGKGTGLGLSMVHGLTSQLGGALLIASRPGLGTTVDMLLPQAEAAAVGAGEAPAAAGGVGGVGVVLLVDDEPAVRSSAADMLHELGFEVVAVDGGQAALAWLGDNRPDYVVTDHLMPGMSGTDLAAAIAELHPGVPTLIISGYADIEGITPDLPRLAKPFRQAELAAAMAALRK